MNPTYEALSNLGIGLAVTGGLGAPFVGMLGAFVVTEFVDHDNRQRGYALIAALVVLLVALAIGGGVLSGWADAKGALAR